MRHVVALDIGGTKIEGVLFDEGFNQIKKERVYFEKKKGQIEVDTSQDVVLKMIVDLIVRLRKGFDIVGIGLSIPDIVNYKGDIVGKMKIKALDDFPIGDYLRNIFKLPVEVKNDADCFALASHRMGAGKGLRNVVGVIWGTGIGAGLVLNNELYSVRSGSTGEFGHNVIDPDGPLCRCGLHGCVEVFVGGQNIIKNYLAKGWDLKGNNSDKIFESKDPKVVDFVDGVLNYFAIGLSQLQNILNPEMIVLGGGLSKIDVYEKLNILTRKYSRDGVCANVNIVKNNLGDSAGVYGAAILVFDLLKE